MNSVLVQDEHVCDLDATRSVCAQITFLGSLF